MRLLIIIIPVLFLTNCSGENKSKLNYENCLKVQIGMSQEEVLEIMGKPDTIFSNQFKENYISFYYTPPALSSSGIDIIIDNNSNKVIEIICSEEN